MDDNTENIPGTQSASKALDLLRLVTAHHPHGASLSDLITESGQGRSTAHRLLACLVHEGFVERTPEKAYRLGVESMQVGLASAAMVSVVDRFMPTLKQLARETGDTVFLMVRSGDYSLCLHREAGPFPIKAFVVEPGSRRPLGASAVGVCVLAMLNDAEVAANYARCAAAYASLGMSLAHLRRVVAATRKIGYSQLTEYGRNETSGVGCAFHLSKAVLIGVSISAINSRMTPDRRAALGAQLLRATGPLAWKQDADR